MQIHTGRVRHTQTHVDTHTHIVDYIIKKRKIVRFTIEAFTVCLRKKGNNEIPNGMLYNTVKENEQTNNEIDSLLEKQELVLLRSQIKN